MDVGADRKANVGMSNDNGGEKPPHRKTKVSCINANRIRVSRGLRARRELSSMDNWLIFQYLNNERCRDGVVKGSPCDGIQG